ncbi:MAG: phosphohydrolase, partial [Thermovirgaceae bacterium]
EGLAGRIVGLLKDGDRIRGGGHGDAAALSFPPHYSPQQIRTSLLSAIRSADEQRQETGLTLGDLFSDAAKGEG